MKLEPRSAAFSRAAPSSRTHEIGVRFFGQGQHISGYYCRLLATTPAKAKLPSDAPPLPPPDPEAFTTLEVPTALEGLNREPSLAEGPRCHRRDLDATVSP